MTGTLLIIYSLKKIIWMMYFRVALENKGDFDMEDNDEMDEEEKDVDDEEDD